MFVSTLLILDMVVWTSSGTPKIALRMSISDKSSSSSKLGSHGTKPTEIFSWFVMGVTQVDAF